MLQRFLRTLLALLKCKGLNCNAPSIAQPPRLKTRRNDSSGRMPFEIPYFEIRRATKNFSTFRLSTGRAASWKVCKGTLLGGQKIAVKRYNPGEQGGREFRNEFRVLSKIRHPHVISLIGYCEERPEGILVYEYITRGTLRAQLCGSYRCSSNRSSPRWELSWEQRLRICIDLAEVVHYLHSRGIIHRDITSRSIFLDENYSPKIADFGLCQMSSFVEHSYFFAVRGSSGYVDPENDRTMFLTEKSDVYSFGVVLLEILCARRAVILTDKEEERSLGEWGALCLKKGHPQKIIDPFLAGNVNSDSLRKFAETAEKCLRARRDERPVMREVLWNLEFAMELQQQT